MVNSVVAYRTVFGCDYHVLTNTTLNEARKCKTVHDLVTHINNDGHFAKYVEEYYGADDSVFTPSNDDKRRMSSNSYWEKNDSNEDIASEDVDVEYKANDNALCDEFMFAETKPSALNFGDCTSEPCILCEVLNEDRSVNVSFCKLMTMEEGWNDKSVVKQLTKSSIKKGFQYKAIYPCLYCLDCNLDTFVTVYDPAYIDCHSKGETWYDTEFISTFAKMVCHVNHLGFNCHEKGRSKVDPPELMLCQFPHQDWSITDIKQMTPRSNCLAVLLFHRNHYAVLVVNMKNRVLSIYDGLGHDLSNWYPHCKYVLKKIGVMDCFAPSPHYFPNHMSITVHFAGEVPSWNIKPGVFLDQSDGHNCGPIACLKFMELFGVTTTNNIKKNLTEKLMRQLVMEQFMHMVTVLKHDLFITQKVDLEDVIKSNHLVCICKDFSSLDLKSYRMPCCGYNFHCNCVHEFIKVNSWCPSCKGDAEEPPQDQKCPTDKVREESATKKQNLQCDQGAKMVAHHNVSLQASAAAVTPGSVVTIWVDRRVASHP